MARKDRRKRESAFQSEVIQELEARWPGCTVRKNPPGYDNGFPDVVAYIGRLWAMFECKRSAHEKHRPNQDWWVDHLNLMGFARFIFPENKDAVLDELEGYVRRNGTEVIPLTSFRDANEEGA